MKLNHDRTDADRLGHSGGRGRLRADFVAILVALALMLSHALTPEESLAGFGSPLAVIAAIFIVGEALLKTGIAHRLGEAGL